MQWVERWTHHRAGIGFWNTSDDEWDSSTYTTMCVLSLVARIVVFQQKHLTGFINVSAASNSAVARGQLWNYSILAYTSAEQIGSPFGDPYTSHASFGHSCKFSTWCHLVWHQVENLVCEVGMGGLCIANTAANLFGSMATCACQNS